MKALVGALNQEKALVGAFSVIVQPVVEPMEHYTALTRNKLWLYNEQMTLNDKPKPLAKTYAKWVEFTDAMAQQVPGDKNI